VACDQDPIAEDYYLSLKGELACPSRFYLGNFADTLSELVQDDFTASHVYLDLGVSSMQIDTTERGFSYSYDAPLDMRMDPAQPLTAAGILNGWTEPDLAELFRKYGEERFSRRIARAVVARRRLMAYSRTSELVDTIKGAIPTPARFGAGNPARRVFQALRIEVNDELNSLRRALPAAFALLAPDGILAVISFHSLEDRIVKEFFAGQVRTCTCPPDFPVCVCGGQTKGEVLTHKALTPGARELEANPRSSSAKLRALRKL
jgi:16S rRNA (cytosine1402-N4)-methyltransferase